MLAVLTDAQREGTTKLAVFRLDDHWTRQEEVYSTEHTLRFPDRFVIVNFNVRVRTIRFPESGVYEFVLFVDDDEIAHRRVRIYKAAPGTFV